MMDGREFLPIAEELSRRDDEAALRSAVSRAYYAAFNFGCQVLDELGIVARRDHGFIHQCFQHCGVEEIEEAGQALADLHSDRIKADYRMSDKQCADSNTVALKITNAKIIISALQECQKKETARKVLSGMRTYRKNTNT